MSFLCLVFNNVFSTNSFPDLLVVLTSSEDTQTHYRFSIKLFVFLKSLLQPGLTHSHDGYSLYPAVSLDTSFTPLHCRLWDFSHFSFELGPLFPASVCLPLSGLFTFILVNIFSNFLRSGIMKKFDVFHV